MTAPGGFTESENGGSRNFDFWKRQPPLSDSCVKLKLGCAWFRSDRKISAHTAVEKTTKMSSMKRKKTAVCKELCLEHFRKRISPDTLKMLARTHGLDGLST